MARRPPLFPQRFKRLGITRSTVRLNLNASSIWRKSGGIDPAARADRLGEHCRGGGGADPGDADPARRRRIIDRVRTRGCLDLNLADRCASA